MAQKKLSNTLLLKKLPIQFHPNQMHKIHGTVTSGYIGNMFSDTPSTTLQKIELQGKLLFY